VLDARLKRCVSGEDRILQILFSDGEQVAQVLAVDRAVRVTRAAVLMETTIQKGGFAIVASAGCAAQYQLLTDALSTQKSL
jgi:hypothetical protein